MGNWMMLIEIEKVKSNGCYGICALIKSLTCFSIVVCRSLSVDSQRRAQLIILREALVPVKEFDVIKINCRDPKTIWRKLLNPDTIVNWTIFPR